MKENTRDLHTVYIKPMSNIVYRGGANFLSGTRKCPHCSKKMEKNPLKQTYLRAKNGKILVETDKEGMLYLWNGKCDWHWACTKCTFAITPTSKMVVVA